MGILDIDNLEAGYGNFLVLTDVTMTVELRVYETATGLRFRGTPLHQGETGAIDTSDTAAAGA